MEMSRVFELAIETYGEREQSAVAMEECAELIRAINKYHRDENNKNRQNLIEEIADVQIMIEQLKIMYDLSEDDIDDVILRKTVRLADRLGKDM